MQLYKYRWMKFQMILFSKGPFPKVLDWLSSINKCAFLPQIYMHGFYRGFSSSTPVPVKFWAFTNSVFAPGQTRLCLEKFKYFLLIINFLINFISVKQMRPQFILFYCLDIWTFLQRIILLQPNQKSKEIKQIMSWFTTHTSWLESPSIMVNFDKVFLYL